MNITYLKSLNPEELKADFKSKVKKEINKIEKKEKIEEIYKFIRQEEKTISHLKNRKDNPAYKYKREVIESNINALEKNLQKLKETLKECESEETKIQKGMGNKSRIKQTESSSESRLNFDRVEITWKDGKISFEKAESISFSDRRLQIEYENETTVIFFKNIKKVKFPSLLSDKKVKNEWTWNPNLGYYDITTTDSVPSWYFNFK